MRCLVSEPAIRAQPVHLYVLSPAVDAANVTFNSISASQMCVCISPHSPSHAVTSEGRVELQRAAGLGVIDLSHASVETT